MNTQSRNLTVVNTRIITRARARGESHHLETPLASGFSTSVHQTPVNESGENTAGKEYVYGLPELVELAKKKEHKSNNSGRVIKRGKSRSGGTRIKSVRAKLVKKAFITSTRKPMDQRHMYIVKEVAEYRDDSTLQLVEAVDFYRLTRTVKRK